MDNIYSTMDYAIDDANNVINNFSLRREVKYLQSKLGGDPLPPAPAKCKDKTLTWSQRRKMDKEAYKAYLNSLSPEDRDEAVARKVDRRLTIGTLAGSVVAVLGIGGIALYCTKR